MSTTLLFTDVEGSTKLLHELGDGYAAVLAEHRRVLREAFGAHGGAEVDTQGDAFFFTFAEPGDSVAAALAAQAALAGGPVRVRMGMHTGEPTRTEEGWVGTDVHLGARVAAAGHGGQVLLTKATRDLLDREAVRNLGEHRVKDFDEPVWIYQLGDDAFAPLKTISNTNLPRPASTFVGREREVREVAVRLRQARLVTLTGPGGSGKTRLSIEAASELVGEFRNGVFWIGLATVRDPAVVLPTVAQTIGAQGDLAGHVGEREMLLLLDNLEQVVEVAPQLGSLLEACPNLKLLVTSREVLRIRGETEYEVLPLADPDAIELFTTRAQLAPTEAIEELCRRLDNMPLALELAAARTKALTPGQILQRLSERLDLFRGGRDADDRQKTLRATIEWSHDLLDVDEQRLFSRLGVFAGGSTLESAEVVAEADIDTVQSLVEKSLLRHTNDRFWMLETIREYAVERLEESGEADATRLRHAGYMVELTETFAMSEETMGRGAEQQHEQAIAELDNVRVALAWALTTERIELAAMLAANLENLWVTQDPTEGVRWFEAILAHGGVLPAEVHARALRCLGSSATIFGDVQRGREAFDRSLAIYRELGQERGVAVLLHRVAVDDFRQGDTERARALVEESLALHRKHDSLDGQAQAVSLLANLEWTAGNQEAALALLQQSVQLAHDAGFTWWEANMTGGVAEWALQLGRFDEAETAARRSLELAVAMRDRQNLVFSLALFALMATLTGRPELAGRLWGAIETEERRGRVGLWEMYRDETATPILAAATPEFETARAEGARLSLDEAVEFALAGRNPVPEPSGETRP